MKGKNRNLNSLTSETSYAEGKYQETPFAHKYCKRPHQYRMTLKITPEANNQQIIACLDLSAIEILDCCLKDLGRFYIESQKIRIDLFMFSCKA